MKKYFLYFFSIFLLYACGPRATYEKDGGMRIVIEVDGTGITKSELQKRQETCLEILRSRINNFGLYEPSLRMDAKPGRIILEFAGKSDMQRLRKLLQASASLSFCETYDNLEVYPHFSVLNDTIANRKMALGDTIIENLKPVETGSELNDQLNQQHNLEEESKNKNKYPLFSIFRPAIIGEAGNMQLQSGPLVGYADAKDTTKVNAFINSDIGKNIFGPYMRFVWGFKSVDNKNTYSLFAIKTKRNGEVSLSGDIVSDARKMFNDNSGGSPQISLTMTREAAFTWARLTKNNIGKSIAIIIDNQVYSYPVVQGEISGGVSSITGNFTIQEVDDFVNVLKAGSLPYRVRIVSEEVILPTK